MSLDHRIKNQSKALGRIKVEDCKYYLDLRKLKDYPYNDKGDCDHIRGPGTCDSEKCPLNLRTSSTSERIELIKAYMKNVEASLYHVKRHIKKLEEELRRRAWGEEMRCPRAPNCNLYESHEHGGVCMHYEAGARRKWESCAAA